jgi:hypothetical protein
MCVLGSTHPRDRRLSFDATEHIYYWDGNRVPVSVSGVWQAHFPRFEPETTVERYFSGWAANPDSYYYPLVSYLRLVAGADEASQKHAICELWAALGREAAAKGTSMHAAIEAHLTGERAVDASVPELAQWLRWKREAAAGWTLLRVEWAVYDDTAQVAGMIDSLWKDEHGRTVMVDWKRSKPGTLQRRAFRGETGTGPCAELPNTPFQHYAVQQALYAAILRRCYNVHVEEAWLLQLHPLLPDYQMVRVPDVGDVADALLDARVGTT